MLQTTFLNALSDPLSQLADSMPQLVWIANADGKVIYFNSRVQLYSGAQRGEDGIWSWQPMIHSDDVGVTGLTWMHSVATGLPYEAEHRMLMADGSYCWHLTRALPQHSADGQVTHWFGTSTNIHQQKHIEQVARESEDRFRILTNTIPQIVWIVNADGKTEFVNESWHNYTAQTPEEAEATGRSAMIHPDDLPVVMEAWLAAQQEGIGAEWEYRLRHKDTGRYTWFAGKVQPLKDSNGTIVKWIGAANDIQALKDTAGLLEQQVAERTQELLDLNVTLNKQAAELQRSNEDLQQFAHVASHDLKEPLRKIRTFAGRLAYEHGSQLPPQGIIYLEKIEASAHRMTQMIDGVLHYSIIDHVEDQQLVPVQLNKVLQHIESDLEVLIQKQGARIIAGELPEVTGVAVLLHQLFFNLINNALKFSKGGVAPLIRIGCRPVTEAEIRAHHLARDRKYAAISVADNGIGFEPAYTDSIFKTFTRLHSKDRYEGTGLGLALCQKIAHRHGGSITALGQLNEGATFTVFLPLAD
jgi:PAS domain S-box-containing protein